MRRRGFTPGAIRGFCEMIGVAKRDSTVDMGKLEWAIRNDLNPRVPRVMAVSDPVRLVIDNYPAGQEEELSAPYFPDDPPKMGHRQVPFCGELWVEREDFMAEPHKKFWRLAPGREVRLRWAYLVTCTGFETDEAGRVTVIHCEYDPATKGGDAPDGRKVKGTIHWVSARHALDAELRLYDRLFLVPNPTAKKGGGDFRDHLNPESLVRVRGKVEPSLSGAEPEERYQFERKGYFCVDRRDSRPGGLVFNRTVTLRDSWAKLLQKEKAGGKGGKGGKG
jgi:glutaminyl-tRNA synthetase